MTLKRNSKTRRSLGWATLAGAALAVSPLISPISSTLADETTVEKGTPKAPAWILNNGPDVADATVGQAELRVEAGLTTMRVRGTDATFSLPIDEDARFDDCALSTRLLPERRGGQSVPRRSERRARLFPPGDPRRAAPKVRNSRRNARRRLGSRRLPPAKRRGRSGVDSLRSAPGNACRRSSWRRK